MQGFKGSGGQDFGCIHAQPAGTSSATSRTAVRIRRSTPRHTLQWSRRAPWLGGSWQRASAQRGERRPPRCPQPPCRRRRVLLFAFDDDQREGFFPQGCSFAGINRDGRREHALVTSIIRPTHFTGRDLETACAAERRRVGELPVAKPRIIAASSSSIKMIFSDRLDHLPYIGSG